MTYYTPTFPQTSQKIYYLGVRYSRVTNQLLTQFRDKNNLTDKPMPKLGFHTTIIHSKTPFSFPLKPFQDNPSIIPDRKIELWNKSLVLPIPKSRLNSVLTEIHNETVKNGGTTDYPKYNPHITLAEDCTEDEIEKIPYLFPEIDLLWIEEIFYKEWFHD